MPPESHTPQRLIRADAELWEAFGKAVEAAGTDRSSVTRDFWRWYARYPDTKLPKRPPEPEEGGSGPTD